MSHAVGQVRSKMQVQMRGESRMSTQEYDSLIIRIKVIDAEEKNKRR